MRAVRSTGDGVEVVDVDEPDGAGELLTMRAASICGSDLGYIAMGSRFVLGRVPSRQPPTGRAAPSGRHRHRVAGRFMVDDSFFHVVELVDRASEAVLFPEVAGR